jgi:carbamoylphosphate synthase large subunit
MREQVIAMAKKLGVIGLMNTQLAYQDDEIYIIEVNPRASRTVPFVSKAIGVPLANIAARVMSGKTLKALNFTTEIIPQHFSVKEAVFPFNKFLGVDPRSNLRKLINTLPSVGACEPAASCALSKAEAKSSPTPITSPVERISGPQAGIHSGDSACSLPPYSLPNDVLDEMREQVIAMVKKLGVIGLMNTQLAYQDDEIYIG